MGNYNEGSSVYPLVSVIIPCYNYAHYICDAIESVLAQDYSNIEIIVVDDGSSDNTFDVVSRYPQVVYVYQENKGLSSARNHGLQIIKGKYLQFLDADDLLGKTSVRKRVEYLEQYPEKSSVICRSAYFRKALLPEYLAFLHREWRQPDSGSVDISLHYFNIAPPHAFLVRRASVELTQLSFDENLKACEDYDFWLRLSMTTSTPDLIKSCWVYYRQHPASMSRSYASQYMHDAILCRRLLVCGNLNGSWQGHTSHSDVDYLAAMLASSLIVARRLWHVERTSFREFFDGHVYTLRDILIQKLVGSSLTITGVVYIAQSRLTLYKMTNIDGSVHQSIYEKFYLLFVNASSHFSYLLNTGGLFIYPFLILRLIKMGIQYSFVRLLFK